MKTLILAAVAALSLAFGAPVVAFAQDVPPPDSPAHMDRVDQPAGEWPIERREDWLQGRIDRASENGRLSGAEEQRGRAELEAIRGEHRRLLERDGGGLTAPDRLYVAQRLNELNRTLRWEGENPPAPWMTE